MSFLVGTLNSWRPVDELVGLKGLGELDWGSWTWLLWGAGLEGGQSPQSPLYLHNGPASAAIWQATPGDCSFSGHLLGTRQDQTWTSIDQTQLFFNNELTRPTVLNRTRVDLTRFFQALAEQMNQLAPAASCSTLAIGPGPSVVTDVKVHVVMFCGGEARLDTFLASATRLDFT